MLELALLLKFFALSPWLVALGIFLDFPTSGLLWLLLMALSLKPRYRLAWEDLGLFCLPRWLCVSLSVGLYGLGWPLLALLLRPKRELPGLSSELTAARATLLLRLPLACVNRALQLIPASIGQTWFRPDPMRLHLIEPLLDTRNAPRFFYAMALALPDRPCTPEELVESCLHDPDRAARVLLQLEVGEQELPAGWTMDNLSNLRKPSKLDQIGHFWLLRRFSKRQA
jgi:hypothetical protein